MDHREGLTEILREIGNSPCSLDASNRLLAFVYDELRLMAANKLRSEERNQTLQATALVHEVWIRLADSLNGHGSSGDYWQNRRHFFGAASEAMRRILIEKARYRKRLKRGGENVVRHDIDESSQMTNAIEDDVLDLHAALEQFERIDPIKSQIVKLKFFAGLTTDEIATATQLSVATVERYWVYSRAWLHQKMREHKAPGTRSALHSSGYLVPARIFCGQTQRQPTHRMMQSHNDFHNQTTALAATYLKDFRSRF
jgi:RNA polymerase sigma factor (TIGR02999 family)